MILDRAAVQAITGDADRWTDALNNACIRWDISSPARVTMFLAQCGHESGGFRSLVEELNYGAAGLRATWPTRFSAADALAMERQPERIAERAYGGRMGNGPEGSGDGYRYRGRGIIQLTGRENYQRAGEAIGLDFVAEPELVERPDWAAATAGWFWATHGCNAFADAGDFLAITKRINGGTNGLADRQAWLAKVQSIIGSAVAPAPIPTQPAAPIEDRSPVIPAETTQEKPSMLASLLPMVLQMFAPRAEAALGKVSSNPTAATALMTEIIGQGGKLLGIPVDKAPTDAQAVEVVAALKKAQAENAALVEQVEAHALDYLDKLAPMFDRLQKADEWQRQSELAGRKEAAERHTTEERDVVRLVVKDVTSTKRYTLASIGAAGVIAIVAKALVPEIPDYVTPLIALAGPLVGKVMSDSGSVIAYYFDGTPTSNAASAINAKIAEVNAQRNGGTQ